VPSDRDNERIDHTATEAVHRPGWGRYPGHPASPYLARTNLPRTCSRSARLAGRGDPRSGLPPHGIQLITGTADFIRHFPPMSAAGTRQHPKQGALLSSSGRCSGGGDGSGALARPTAGLLWPRGV
jgi:hypothetical protein